MELSCSPPISVNHSLSLPSFSLHETGRRCRKIVSFCPRFAPTTSSSSVAPSNICSTSSSSSSYFGISVSRNCGTSSFPNKSEKRSFYVVSGVFERFTERAIKAVMFSQREAKALGRDMVHTHHLLLGLIAEDRAPDGFLGSGITIDLARETVRSLWEEERQTNGSTQSFQQSEISATDVPFSAGTKRIFEAAVEYSRSMGYNFIAPEHIAIGLLTVDDGHATSVLQRLGVNMNYLADVAIARLEAEVAKDGRELASTKSKRSRETAQHKKAAVAKSPAKSKEKNALDLFCVDLTALALAGAIDPVIGRDTEIKRIIQILARKTKSNPILLGEAGVGKTAIAEGLALCITDGMAPLFLTDKRILSLDIGLLIAGAKERGELEERVTMLLKEIKKSGDVILFIDEVHTLVGSGTASRGSKGAGLDIANLLKPSLGRGEFQCIASTTLDEFRLHFEKDKALARRFQPVLINEPSQEDAIQILLGLRDKYESHHRCVYTLEAINAAVNLSARYIPDRHLPDKAIDLIDEAGSRANMEAYKRRKENQTLVLSKSPSEYWKEIRAIQAWQQTTMAKKLRDNDSISFLEKGAGPKFDQSSSPSFSDEIVTVGPEDVAAVASLWSGIPVNKLSSDERMLLVSLNEQLKKRVVGQGEAVDAICRAVKRSRVGLKDPDRPIASMLFCGPTGVGKTELTKSLAACYFGSESAMLRLDMSEYMERHSVSKLIGAPPGYVGYAGGGTLTEAIRRQPFTVVLLDEIEKAHPDIFNILLQLFEDGHLTDSQGRRVSFKNALIVMTSNVGSAAIVKGRQHSIGFLVDEDVATSYAGMKALVMEELKLYFRPELLNRIDEVVVFHPLEKSQMLQILDTMLSDVRKRLASHGIRLEISQAAMDFICEQGYDRSYGARPLRRAVTLLVEDLVSESLLSGNYEHGDVATLHMDDSGNPVVNKRSQHSQVT